MSWSASALGLLEPLYELVQDFSISNALFFLLLAPIDLFRLYYQGSVLLRLTPSHSRWSFTRRPMWKTEAKSAAAAKRSFVFGTAWVPAAVSRRVALRLDALNSRRVPSHSSHWSPRYTITS